MPFYLDPLDSAGWEAAILDYSNASSPSREVRIQRSRSFKLPDWDSHFAAVEHWLGVLDRTVKAGQHGLDQRLHC